MVKTKIWGERTILPPFSLSSASVERGMRQSASWKQDQQDAHTGLTASGRFRASVLFHSSSAAVISLDLSHCNARKSLSVQFVVKMSIDVSGRKKEKKEKSYVWHKTPAPSFAPLISGG